MRTLLCLLVLANALRRSQDAWSISRRSGLGGAALVVLDFGEIAIRWRVVQEQRSRFAKPFDLIMQVGNDLAQTGPLEMSHRPVGRVPDPVNGLAGRPAASM